MTIGALDPLSNPQAWDVLRLAGVDTPGRCDISGFKRGNDWDVKKGKGSKGATLTFTGQPPAKGPIKFYAWRRDHFAAWDELLPLIKFDPDKDPKTQAFDIFHPALADIDVSSVVAEGIGAWEHEGGGLYVRSIDFLEFTQPKPAISTPTGAADQSSFTGTPPENAPAAQAANTNGAAADGQQALGAVGP